MTLTRRQTLALGGSALLSQLLLDARGSAHAAGSDTLTIAYNVNLPSFDPTVGSSAVNPTIQAIYRSIFDHYIDQNPDLSFKPGLLTGWGWNDDRTKIWLEVRRDVRWQDGTPLTPDDIVWSLERAAKKERGNPIQFIWSTIGNYKVEGNRIVGDVLRFDPTLFKWMGFITAYVLPKAYYEKVGAQGFEKKPVGSGPYMVDEYSGNAFLRLKANPYYWGERPAFQTVIFKFITDAASRVAEIESGSSDITFDMPYEEYDRLIKKDGLAGEATLISDIGMIYITNKDVMLDKNVRLAAIHAIDKQAIIGRLLHGYGVPIDTLAAPIYAAFDPTVTTPYDPKLATELLKASGYSPENPARFTIQTTKGFKPKDYEMIQAIVGMWRKVGIAAEIEVYEIAKHFELVTAHKLAPAAFYNWGNAIGDPTTSTGFSMFGPSIYSAWKSDDLDARIAPLWSEKDEKKRMDGWKAVDRYIAEQGYIIPLLQYAQPMVFKSSLKVKQNVSGALQPALVTIA